MEDRYINLIINCIVSCLTGKCTEPCFCYPNSPKSNIGKWRSVLVIYSNAYGLSCTTFIRIFFFSLSIGQTQHHARNQEITEGDSINGMAQHSMPKKRYFIIKSLNYHNIEKSIQRGIWATQAMNEPVLNEAFEVGLLLNYASLLYIPFSNFNSG